MNEKKSYRTFNELYPFYLSEHANRDCRRLHFLGTTTALVLLITAFVTQSWLLIIWAFVQGYAFAWIGHFFFEHRQPPSNAFGSVFSATGVCGGIF